MRGLEGWPEVLALLTSIGFGALSAVFPLANAETYVLVSQVSATAGAVPVAIGISVGQTIGKVALFLGVRTGRRSTFAHRQRDRLRQKPVGLRRRRFRNVMRRLLLLVGTRRWGLPIVLLAAVIGLPPLYAVALLAGATRMRIGWFAATVLIGRLARFVLVAVAPELAHHG